MTNNTPPCMYSISLGWGRMRGDFALKKVWDSREEGEQSHCMEHVQARMYVHTNDESRFVERPAEEK